MDDELRVLQQQLQQDTDALADNAQAIKVSKFKIMRDSQVKRNVDVKVIVLLVFDNYFFYFLNVMIH